MKKEKTIVFIDNGYLRKITEYFGGGIGTREHIKCHINSLAIKLAKEKDLWCDGIYFYTAPLYQSREPTPDEKGRKKSYDNYIEKLKTITPCVNIREGRCQKDDKGNYHQKGVDSHLIMDLFNVSKRRDIKKVILLGCDTDFVPVIERVQREYHIKIILAYLFTKKRKDIFSMSNHIIDICEEKILLNKNHFEIPELDMAKVIDKQIQNLYK